MLLSILFKLQWNYFLSVYLCRIPHKKKRCCSVYQRWIQVLAASSSMQSRLNPHYESSLSACLISTYQLFFISCLFVGNSSVYTTVQRHLKPVPLLTEAYFQNNHNSCWEASSFQTPCFWCELIKTPGERCVAAPLAPGGGTRQRKYRAQHTQVH